MSRLATITLAFGVLVSLGCGTTGPPKTLESTRPADLSIALAKHGSRGLCPGFSDHLIIRVTDTDGGRHATTGPGAGHLLWPNFDIAMSGGTVDLKGRVRLIPNAERLAFKPPSVSITPIHWPKRGRRLALPVRFDCPFKAHFGGRHGRRGKPGLGGLTVDGSVSLLNVRGQPLVRVVLRSSDGTRGGSFLLAPKTGTLTISVRGGNGSAADAERGFSASRGGDGGRISLRVDPGAKAFMSQIRFDTRGGAAGGEGTRAGAPGPPPTITYGKVFEPL